MLNLSIIGRKIGLYVNSKLCYNNEKQITWNRLEQYRNNNNCATLKSSRRSRNDYTKMYTSLTMDSVIMRCF